MEINAYLDKVKTRPETLEFNQLMDLIDNHYDFIPTEFSNGDLINTADQNQGSCKLFSFAKFHGLNQQETLACFGAFYHKDVLQNPAADSHQNIRNFMETGWDGISFTANALTKKN